MLRPLVTALTRSPLAARLLFGGSYGAPAAGAHHFDVTSLGLLREARRTVRRGARVLDMGTGSAALLGLWCWRRRGCRVVCTDRDPAIAREARAAVERNGAPLPVVCCALFDGVRGPFDVVLFNPPYVPTAVGEERALPARYRSQWDGGPEGTSTIEAFVRGFAAAAGDATGLLGVNRRHAPRARVTPLLGDLAYEVRAHPVLPVDVYVLRNRKSPSASTSSPEE